MYRAMRVAPSQQHRTVQGMRALSESKRFKASAFFADDSQTTESKMQAAAMAIKELFFDAGSLPAGTNMEAPNLVVFSRQSMSDFDAIA